MFNTNYYKRKPKIKRLISSQTGKKTKQISSSYIPTPRYEPSAPVGYPEQKKEVTRKIPFIYHGELGDLLTDKSSCECKMPIDKSGYPVTISEVRVHRSSNPTDFTFLVNGVGHGSDILNQNELGAYTPSNKDTMDILKCFTFIPGKMPKFKNVEHTKDIIYTDGAKYIRDAIDKIPMIEKVKKEVKNYLKEHKSIQVADDSNPNIMVGPKNEDEYVDHIIKLAHLCDVEKVKKDNAEVLKISKGDNIQIDVNTFKAYYDFVHMTVSKQKLFMDKNWDDKTKELAPKEFLPSQMYHDSLKLIEDIQGKKGLFTHLTLNFKPVMKEGFNIEQYISERQMRKNEYHTIFLELEVKYNVKTPKK